MYASRPCLPGSSARAIRRLARIAPVSKYSHHMATAPTNAIRKPVIVTVFHSNSANPAPVTRIDSPRAMMTKRPQRSARWVPSMSQSVVLERPRPGTRNDTHGPAYQPDCQAHKVAIVRGAMPAQRGSHEERSGQSAWPRTHSRTSAPSRRMLLESRRRGGDCPASARAAAGAPEFSPDRASSWPTP